MVTKIGAKTEKICSIDLFTSERIIHIEVCVIYVYSGVLSQWCSVFVMCECVILFVCVSLSGCVAVCFCGSRFVALSLSVCVCCEGESL